MKVLHTASLEAFVHQGGIFTFTIRPDHTRDEFTAVDFTRSQLRRVITHLLAGDAILLETPLGETLLLPSAGLLQFLENCDRRVTSYTPRRVRTSPAPS